MNDDRYQLPPQWRKHRGHRRTLCPSRCGRGNNRRGLPECSNHQPHYQRVIVHDKDIDRLRHQVFPTRLLSQICSTLDYIKVANKVESLVTYSANPRYFFWSGHGKPKSAVADDAFEGDRAPRCSPFTLATPTTVPRRPT